MHIQIITLFPEMFHGVIDSSIVKRAREDGKISIHLVNLRDFGLGKHKTVDDKPYGGGAGMVLRIDVLEKAIESVRKTHPNTKAYLLDPKGTPFSQEVARSLSQENDLTLICGHYEGVDARISHFIDGEISMGDFILTGGEIPAMAVMDAVVRLIPGVLGNDESSRYESFADVDGKKTLEHDHYTRPEVYKDLSVPSSLLSGDPKKVSGERTRSAKKNTQEKRPDL